MKVEEQIRKKLKASLEIKLLEIINESSQHSGSTGDESHFRVLIVSPDFQGLNTIQRHRKVYKILELEMAKGIHAFSQRTLTPQEWIAVDSVSASSPPCHNKRG